MTEMVGYIDQEIQPVLYAGRGQVYFLSGWAFRGNDTLKKVVFRCGEMTADLDRICLPRRDVYKHLMKAGSIGRGQHRQAAMTGFSGYIEIDPSWKSEHREITVDVYFKSGAVGQIYSRGVEFMDQAAYFMPVKIPQNFSRHDELVAIAMTTYNPKPAAFARQIQSLKDQKWQNWFCVISDDNSKWQNIEEIRKIIGDDPRFCLIRNSRNLGFYKNNEELLRRIPIEASYVSLSDQDDIWYPEKIEECIHFLQNNAQCNLVYSDMRIVNNNGDVISETYWRNRKNQYTDLETMLIANTVTGAASVFRRDLLDSILPFPQEVGQVFHDHVIACMALAQGQIGYVNRPLYDYVQYGDNIIGHCDFQEQQSPPLKFIKVLGSLLIALIKLPRIRNGFHGLLNVYSHEYVRLAVINKTLKMRTIGNRVPDLLNDGPGAVAKLLSVHRKISKRGQSTDNAELRLLKGYIATMLYRRLYPLYLQAMRLLTIFTLPLAILRFLRRFMRGSRLARRAYHRLVRPVLAVSPGELKEEMERKIAPLKVVVDPEEPLRVNMIIPEVNFKSFFGGYIGKFNLIKKILQKGHLVRCLIVDWCDMDTDNWRREIFSRYEGLEAITDQVEFLSCFDRSVPVTFNPGDSIIASTWWTAHIANSIMEDLDCDSFLYMIQEFEPFTFPMGSYYALAMESYEFPHNALFSTAFLREYFKLNRLGVFAGPGGSRKSHYFNNAILNFNHNGGPMTTGGIRKFLFYARPEPHASRNMFETGYVALCRAIENDVFPKEWEYYSIGTDIGDIALPKGQVLRAKGKLDLSSYREVLPQFHVGMSLMYTPHPSLVPLEMAAAGQVVVTNACMNKTVEMMEALSANIICGQPTITGVQQAIARAVEEDSVRKERQLNQVNWPFNWDDALNEAVMIFVARSLHPDR